MRWDSLSVMEHTETTPEPETKTKTEPQAENEAGPDIEPEPETDAEDEAEADPEPETEAEPASGDAHVSRDNAMGSRTDNGHNSGARKVGQASSGARKL